MVHEGELDRLLLAACMRIEKISIEAVSERFDTQMNKEGMLGAVAGPEHGTEATWIAQTNGLFGHDQVEMVVWARFFQGLYDAQTPGHPQMQDQTPAFTIEQQIFSTAGHGYDAPTAQDAVEIAGDGPAQLPLADHYPGDIAAQQMRLDAPTGDFDFRKFWHGLELSPSAYVRERAALLISSLPSDAQRAVSPMPPLFRTALALMALAGLSACAHQATDQDKIASEAAVAEAKTAPAPEPEPSPAEEKPSAASLPKQKLSNDILYGFLIGEMAAQRGDYPLAAQTFLELTRRTRDPRIARRAVEMAVVARQPQTAIEATRLWVATEPDAAEAHYAMAQIALQTGQQATAYEEIRKATSLKPDWESAVLMEAQLLQRMQGNAPARDRLAAHLQSYPLAHSVRINYGRLLWAEKNYPQARIEFERVLKDNPANLDVLITVAELSAQLQDYDSAERYFKRVLEEDGRNNDLARIYLGQIAEARKNYDEALTWYASVGPGEHHMTAQFRHAQLQVKQGNLEGALAFLRKIVPATNQQRVQIAMAEAAILNAAKREQEAFDVLAAALEKLPNDSELLYRYSMSAEKIGRFDLMESSLRKLIKLQPDHAHAHNALGYALADRNERLAEAHELIDKAAKLAPDDYFIMDSMGWVLYRQGKNEEAISWLQRAYAGRTDAEIAAHLGEVLWVSGKKEEAQKMWDEALSKTPDNEVLLKTIQRFKP